MSTIRSISIAGTGNVAGFMARLFHSHGIEVKAIWGRNFEAASGLAQQVDAKAVKECEELSHADSDLIVIAVKDDAIIEVSNALPIGALIVHTSGFAPLEWIKRKHHRAGTFYPLQTISKLSRLEPSMVPILLEVSESTDLNALVNLANQLHLTSYQLDSDQRRKVHLAAVFVNNFGNHLAFIANKLLQEQNLDYTMLKPLIVETAAKLQYLSPESAQTGPAIRKDLNTMKIQKALLQSHPDWLAIYELMSISIMNQNGTAND